MFYLASVRRFLIEFTAVRIVQGLHLIPFYPNRIGTVYANKDRVLISN